MRIVYLLVYFFISACTSDVSGRAGGVVSPRAFVDWKSRLGRIAVKRQLKKPIRIRSTSELLKVIDERVVSVADLDIRGCLGRNNNSGDAVHPVVRAMQERVRSHSKPGGRRDGYKIALCIEGGGMSGCVAAGMVSALYDLGIHDAIDVVYGSSAGALVGAYLISGERHSGPEIYYNELSGKKGRERFIDKQVLLRFMGLGALQMHNNLWNFIRGRKRSSLFNLKFLLHNVVSKVKPMNWEVFWHKQANDLQPLKLVCSGMCTEEAVVLSAENNNFLCFQSFLTCLEAALNVPGVSEQDFVRLKGERIGRGNVASTWWRDPVGELSIDLVTGAESVQGGTEPINMISHAAAGKSADMKHRPTVSFGSEPLVDALVFEPIPYRSAVRDNCTHILVLRTTPDGVSITKRMSLAQKLIVNRYFGGKFPNLLEWMQKQMNLLVLAEDMLILNEANACHSDINARSGGSGDYCSVSGHKGEGAVICSIALPEGATGVRRLELSQQKLFNGVRDGYAAAYDVMSNLENSGNGTLRAMVLWPDTLLQSNHSLNLSMATRLRRMFPAARRGENRSNNSGEPMNRRRRSFLWLSRVVGSHPPLLRNETPLS